MEVLANGTWIMISVLLVAKRGEDREDKQASTLRFILLLLFFSPQHLSPLYHQSISPSSLPLFMP